MNSNFINTKNLNAVKKLERNIDDIISELLAKVLKKALVKGVSLEINATSDDYNPETTDLYAITGNEVKSLFLDEENTPMAHLSNNEDVQLCYLTANDLLCIISTLKCMVREEDVKQLLEISNKMNHILTEIIKHIVTESAPESMIIEIDSLSLSEPLCFGLYCLSYTEVSKVWINDEDGSLWITLNNTKEVEAIHLNHYDLLQIMLELA